MLAPERMATLAFPADAGMLIVARAALAGYLRGIRAPDAVADDLRLVLSEVCANAIVHGAGGDAGQEVEVELRSAPGGVEIAVRDAGAGWPDRARHGTGTALLDGLCSRWAAAERPGGGTEVVFALDFEDSAGIR